MAKARKKTVENDNSEFFEALRLMEEERGIPQQFIAEKIADAIVVAARKDYGGNDIVSCVIDPENKIVAVYMKNSRVDGGAGNESAVNFEIAVHSALL